MPAAYQTDVDLASFAGVNQSTDGYNMSIRLAQYAYNCDFTGGSLAPVKAGAAIGNELPAPVDTLAYFHRRYVENPDDRDYLVAIAGGKVYTKHLNDDDDWVERFSGLKNSECDYVTYEVNIVRDPVTGQQMQSESPVDVLLFTNADDGMYILYGDSMTVGEVPTPYKFGTIARHYDRIWGSGITDEPDMLVYSTTYDPLDWTAYDAEDPDETRAGPEDCSGYILQPTWDGDRFVALKSYGTGLLAFKRNGVFRISGSNPAEYVIREQHGAGAIVQNTICQSGDLVYMLGWQGMMYYGGGSVEPFQQDAIRDIMGRMTLDARDMAYAITLGKKLYLSIPIDGSFANNCVIEYSITDRCWSVITGIHARSFMVCDDRLFYTSSEAPGVVFEWGKGDVLPVQWASGFQDLGIKTSVKSAFTIYFTVDSEKSFVPLVFRIRTEKKAKEKFVMAQVGRSKSININASGRYFRLEIESSCKDWWRLVGGIRIHCELDPDF